MLNLGKAGAAGRPPGRLGTVGSDEASGRPDGSPPGSEPAPGRDDMSGAPGID